MLQMLYLAGKNSGKSENLQLAFVEGLLCVVGLCSVVKNVSREVLKVSLYSIENAISVSSIIVASSITDALRFLLAGATTS